MKPLGLGKVIEARAQAANKPPREWLAEFITEQGSITNAADELQTSRQALSAKCRRYGVKVAAVKRQFVADL